MTHTFGIDPGASGAIALLDGGGDLIWVEEMPHHGGIVSAPAVRQLFQRTPTCNAVAWIEDVHAMPQQGVSSTFKFGRAHGTVIGVLGALDIPIRFVAPAKWKKHFGLTQRKDLTLSSSAKSAASKTASRRQATEAWPAQASSFSLVKDDGKAEASLIALYGLSLTRPLVPNWDTHTDVFLDSFPTMKES